MDMENGIFCCHFHTRTSIRMDGRWDCCLLCFALCYVRGARCEGTRYEVRAYNMFTYFCLFFDVLRCNVQHVPTEIH